MKFQKYSYPQGIKLPERKWPNKRLDKAPIFCSVDLRDGNQALPCPMGPEKKLKYFKLLTRIGFKQIEVAFPSSSAIDYSFCRELIEGGHIPDDVFISGLTSCRLDLIEKTMQAFHGAKRAIVHAYIATSELHMENVFYLKPKKVLAKALESIVLIKKLSQEMPETDVQLQFSPEEFTDTDFNFAMEICIEVYKTWGKASAEKPIIFNLPATVERLLPNQYADLIEKFILEFPYRDNIQVSLHAHNDQGMAVAATELGLLAGADRVEGVLLGHGERAGNCCLLTLANNLRFRGIKTGLDFSRLVEVADEVVSLTGMPISERHPYAGELVCSAFSGSHQDAIEKTLMIQTIDKPWKVAYLHFDPHDVGREYEKMIRINSQSGKAGAAGVLRTKYGLEIPKSMLAVFGDMAKELAENLKREVEDSELYVEFQKKFMNNFGPITLEKYWPKPDNNLSELVNGEARLQYYEDQRVLSGTGNGPIDAFVKMLRQLQLGFEFEFQEYYEQSIGIGEDAVAVAYVSLLINKAKIVWGVGNSKNTSRASALAVVAALNQVLSKQ